MTIFDAVRSWSGPRNHLACLRLVTYSITVVLLLSSSMLAETHEKPIMIGALALGPRVVPDWHCGPGEYRLADAEPRRETLPPSVLGLRNELKRLKYVEDRPENAGKPGRRFVLDLRMGTLEEARGFAREFAHNRVDMIVAVSTAMTQIAKEETRNYPTPIVMASVSDPVADGFAQSLAHPGGLITGTGHQMMQESGKRVDLFKAMVPGLRRLITIRRPGYRPSEESMAEIRAVAAQLKIDVLEWGVASREELRSSLAKARWEAGDGIMVLPDTHIISNIDLVLESSLEHRVPVFGVQDFMADWGALAAYGPSAYQSGTHSAIYVEKISRGAKPGDLPVEPLDPTFVVNLKVAECFGLSPPVEVLHQADRVLR